jgi:hypothetical protein
MKIYLVGDSISVHYGRHLATYLRGIIYHSQKEGEAEALQDLDKPQGANTGDSAMLLAFLQEKAQSGGIGADLVLFNCGLHDIKTDPATGARQISQQQYGENLRAILKVVIEMGVKPVWVRTTPCDESVHNRKGLVFQRFSADCVSYNALADEVMKEAGIPTIDLYTFTLNLGPDLYCDHVHFHEPIREKQAAYIAGWLSAYGGNAGTQAGRRAGDLS